MKKNLLVLVIALVGIFTLASCEQVIVDPTPSVDKTPYLVKEAAKKIDISSYKDYWTEAYQTFLSKTQVFSSKITYATYLESDKKENFCISPISVYMALALAIEISNGDTREEILKAVGVTYEEVLQFTSYLYAFANDTIYSNEYTKEVAAIKELHNSFWTEEHTSLLDAGVSNLANQYHCDLYRVPFQTNLSAASKEINDYINKKTHGLIKGGIEPNEYTRMILLNTFYLKDIWNDEGDELLLTDDAYEFTNSDQSKVLSKLLVGNYFEGQVHMEDSFSTFYTKTKNNVRIEFILPNNGYTIDQIFTEETLNRINQITDYQFVDEEKEEIHYTRVLFPEFEASYDDSIKKILADSFKIIDLFTGDCDASNITDEDVYCSDVIHKCKLKVDKKGIEGAAVTAMIMGNTAAPIDFKIVKHDFIIDRAFGFIVVDNYNAVLFSGVVKKI